MCCGRTSHHVGASCRRRAPGYGSRRCSAWRTRAQTRRLTPLLEASPTTASPARPRVTDPRETAQADRRLRQNAPHGSTVDHAKKKNALVRLSEGSPYLKAGRLVAHGHGGRWRGLHDGVHVTDGHAGRDVQRNETVPPWRRAAVDGAGGAGNERGVRRKVAAKRRNVTSMPSITTVARPPAGVSRSTPGSTSAITVGTGTATSACSSLNSARWAYMACTSRPA